MTSLDPSGVPPLEPPAGPSASAAGPSGAPAAPVAPRIAASIDHWKRCLLDLSKRNRALHFRMTKVSTLAIVGEEPAEVFRRLWGEERSMRFKAREPTADTRHPARGRPPGAEPVPGGDVQWADESDAADPELPSGDFHPYDSAAPDASRIDRVLQVAATEEQLDRSLRRIDEQARLALEEQGVNTLFLTLGILHYRESRDSDEVSRAPLVLLPVALERKSARAGFTLAATDDDPLVNPALVEYLRRGFGITLPELPNGEGGDGSDLQPWLAAVAQAVADQQGWAVKSDIYLGLFSFQKLVMYKDLETNGGAFVGHRLIQQLVTRSGTELGLPDDVRGLDLDREHPPESTCQVVDADSSQLRAIAAVARGYDLVLEGPPGTGKSQTITNLIAHTLSEGKSVLFVAEKMAALQVVYRRLRDAGLGEFCLELHSTKGSKRTVMRDLAVALDASLQRPPPAEVSAARLAEVRGELTTYANAVHTPHGALGISPYRAYGELGRILDAPRVAWSGSVEGVTREQLQQVERDLRDLAETARPLESPATHPWRDAQRTFYSEDDLDAVRRLVPDLSARMPALRALAEEIGLDPGIPHVSRLADIESVDDVGAVLARSPGAPLPVLTSEAWDQPHSEALALIQTGRAIGELKQRVLARFTPAVMESAHASDIAYIEQKLRSRWKRLAIVDAHYRAIRRRWRRYRLPTYRGSLREQARDMHTVDQLRQERVSLAAREAVGRDLFGDHWRGEGSDWRQLEAYVHWVADYRRVAVRYGLTDRADQVAARGPADLSRMAAFRTAATDAESLLAEVRVAVGWPATYLADVPFEQADDRLRAVAASIESAPRWATFEAARVRVAAGLAADLLTPAMAGEVAFADLAPAFLRAFYQKWLGDVVRLQEPLRRFNTLTHENRVQEFRDLDQAILVANRAALVAKLRDAVQNRLRAPELAAPMGVLRREMAKQRRLSPLRQTMRDAHAAIRTIKPCVMMSPLSVAQFLPGQEPSFDLVVFDEASQLPPEDAAGAIVRGRQLVVVGDPKQLPPTDFFVVMDDGAAPRAADGTPLYTDGESVLEEFQGAGVPQSRLRWHYRSLHESLITFSNASFYDADLHTFPSVETDSDALGVRFDYVRDGVYEGQGLNRVEARRVADAVVEHARQHPSLSLGVGTFSLRQQLAIQDELEVRRRQDPSLEPFFSRGVTEPFFVKNLENIQGDERDVIFISVTYAKGPDGRLRYQFGPLNMENGWRRLNVLVTRARRRMCVFSSMRGEEISVVEATARGARLLREFLVYAEHGRIESGIMIRGAQTESPFERDVLGQLDRRGLTLQPQVGASGYRIDFGVLDEAIPGRFLCGIECDGIAYHSSETARDRDRLRQEVLEKRGWTIHRIWSTDWFKDRAGQIERILRLVDETRARVRQEAAMPPTGQPIAGGGTARSTPSEPPTRSADATSNYVRPTVAAYRFAAVEGRSSVQDILDAPTSRLAHAVTEVAAVEAPLHIDDLTARIAGMWATSRGSRILGKIMAGITAAERSNAVQRRGDFVWLPSGAFKVRSRADTGIPADRIAPEEYREAVLMVLRAAGGVPREELAAEVRAVFGFSRLGPVLEEAIGSAIDALLASGVIGEGGSGVTLRGCER